MPIAIVTGASRGIGAATARLLARRGWDVCVTFQHRAAEADVVVADCESFGRRAFAMQVDVAVEDDVMALFRAVDERLGTLSALVNNAGIVAPKQRVDGMDAERLRRIFTVNVVGPFLCAREASLRMSTRHGGTGGSIVNISSIAARLGSPGEYVDYAASKAAIDTMTRGLALELANEGVRVNAVRPGIIATELHASGGQPDRVERLKGNVPMLRAGTAEEVAYAAAWLCSDEASYVTGTLLDVGGGR